MGCSTSKPNILGENGGDGGDEEYKGRFEEGDVLGEGEFGVVKLVTEKSSGTTYASKCLRKGVVFKDNTLYPPMAPEALKRECDILRALGGEHHNMKLVALYEGSSAIYMVTEICSGGEMLDYVADAYPEGLRTEDASRMSFQLLDAIDHCARNGVIHRDLKPENVMFTKSDAGSDLRLIDFGCSTRDEVSGTEHKTFAGTAFYLAPEVFQKSYTTKADVFSIGVVLYVIVAGYPADVLQKAFNMLQKSKRDLRKLPGMPDNMPDTYFELLNELLTYKPAKRKAAGDLLTHEFVSFHKELAAEASGRMMRPSGSIRRTNSVVFKDTGNRHKLYQRYSKFQRSVTTILATIPTRDQLKVLLKKMKDIAAREKDVIMEEDEEEEEDSEDDEKKEEKAPSLGMEDNAEKLNVIKVDRLMKLLKAENLSEAADTISKLTGFSDYGTFAYDIEMLEEFAKRRNPAASGGRGAAASSPEEADKDGEAAASLGRGLQGTKGGGMSMRGSFNAGGSGSARGRGLVSGMSFRKTGSGRAPKRGDGMKKAMSVFL